MNTITNYLQAFFNEKQIPNTQYSIEGKNGVMHIISNEVVIEHILNTSTKEKLKISNILRAIDYKNGSVSHFLKYLAFGLVKNYTN